MNDFLSKYIDYVKEIKLKKMNGMQYKYGSNGKLKKDKGKHPLIRYFKC